MIKYWLDRVTLDEEAAQKIAMKYLKQEQKLYKELLDDIEEYIDKLYGEIGKRDITRSELWQFNRYVLLKDAILNRCSTLGLHLISITESALTEVFKTAIGMDLSKDFTVLAKANLDRVLGSRWSGSNFSARIWKNTNELAAKLQEDISRMLCLGDSPTTIVKQLKTDMGVSYDLAQRLVRTEASYAFNQGTLAKYNEMGVDEVEVIVEHDAKACEECSSYDGKTYKLSAAPFLPVHPNCRCCYAPVVKTDK